MVRSLSEKTKSAEPTAFHHLLATLAQEGRLLRLYSQNVDGIDTSLPPLQTQIPLPKKGPWPKTIQLHGGLDKMVCTKCHTLSEFDAGLFNGPVPPACSNCEENDAVRQVAEKRSHGIGRLRPRMVLYNEFNPDDEAIGSVASTDLRARPDAIIVVGTTLKVPGVRRIAREMCAVVRDRRDGVTIWINNEPEPPGKDLADCWDLVVRGPCDEVARHAAMRHWDDDYKEVTPEEINRIRAENNAKVVVESPRKQRVVNLLQDQLVTPAASPRMAPLKARQEPAKPGPTTPSKRGRKRKAEVAQIEEGGGKPVGRAKAGRPPAKKPKAAAKKPAAKKTKAKAKENTAKITNKFHVSKPAVQLRNLKESKDSTIVVTPHKKPMTTKFIECHPAPMAPISPQEARNNTAPPHHPPNTKESFHSSPLSPPPQILVMPEGFIATDSRPSSSSSRNGGTISPTGRLPNFSHALIDTEVV